MIKDISFARSILYHRLKIKSTTGRKNRIDFMGGVEKGVVWAREDQLGREWGDRLKGGNEGRHS